MRHKSLDPLLVSWRQGYNPEYVKNFETRGLVFDRTPVSARDTCVGIVLSAQIVSISYDQGLRIFLLKTEMAPRYMSSRQDLDHFSAR